MGLANCDSNMWAIHLKGLILQKISVSYSADPLLMNEDLRTEEFTRNNHKIYKYLKQLQALQERRASSPSILFTNIAYINQEIEKIHINKVKEMLLQSLN
jgi:hypothetical protein